MLSIGIYHPKTEMNVGTLWRAAHLYGADMLFTIGHRYRPQGSDTTRAWRHIPLINYPDFNTFQQCRPLDAEMVGVEQAPGRSKPLSLFTHQPSAVYLLGAEDHGLPPAVLDACQRVVEIEVAEPTCMNVAMAGTVVLYDRHIKFKGSA